MLKINAASGIAHRITTVASMEYVNSAVSLERVYVQVCSRIFMDIL